MLRKRRPLFTEEEASKIADKVCDLVMIEGLFFPKTEPLTEEQCRENREDPEIEHKMDIVKRLLSVQNLKAASEHVDPCNVDNYAKWVLHHAHGQVRRFDPVSKSTWIDPEAEKWYYNVEEILERADLFDSEFARKLQIDAEKKFASVHSKRFKVI